MKINYLFLALFFVTFASIGSAQAVRGNVRNIDFKNFNYGALCPGTHKFLSTTSDKLRLTSGHQEHGDSGNYADLGSVQYVDLDRDGTDEAFVVVKGQTSGSSSGYLSAYVFAYRNGRAKQIWSKCEENSTAELKGRQVIFTSPEWLKNDAHCCFSYVSTATYGWKAAKVSLLSTTRQKSSEIGSSSETETVEQLAERVAKAFLARNLREIDGTKAYGAGVTLIVDHSLSEKRVTRKFTRLKDADRWLLKEYKYVNPNGGKLESCKKGVCTYASEGMLHNNLYLVEITYGTKKGRPFLKSMSFLDGD